MSEAMLDTGVWFAYYVKHDSFHQEANAIVDGLLLRKKKILLSEASRVELMNILTHELLSHEQVRQIGEKLRNMAPYVEIRFGGMKFWDEFLLGNFSRLFLKTMDFIVASYALYWEIDEFYSFDEKLNRALRRIKPEMVKVKIKKGKIILEAKPH